MQTANLPASLLPLVSPGDSPGVVRGQPRFWLGLEGFAVLAGSTAVYPGHGLSWTWFFILFFVPDAALLGYLFGSRIGATSYNLLHNYVLPIILAIILHFAGRSVAIALIWAAHVGFDRMLGYGLMYGSGFGMTHLSWISKHHFWKSTENHDH